MACATCGKQGHLLGFDYGHDYKEGTMCLDAFKDEDFISSTIRNVDAMLAQERKEELRDASAADCAALREKFAAAGDRKADEWDTESLAEYEEWSREVSEQTDAYFDVICGAHGDERGENGLCPQCEQELAQERIDDK